MDRPPQEPPPPPDGPAGAQPTGSPLDFPVEVPRATGVASSAEPLDFPVEAPRPPAPHPAVEAARPIEVPQQLPVPVAELPGLPFGQVPQASGPVPEPQPSPVEERPSSLLRFLPPLLTAVAGVLTLGGCFLPLFRIDRSESARQFSEIRFSVTETAWGSRFEVPGQETIDQPGSPVGIPLLVAVVVLVAAALVAFARPDGRLARSLSTAGAMFTAGVVATIGMSGLGWWSPAAESAELDVTTAVGMWLLLTGTVAAAVAAVVAHLPGLRRATADWADPTLAYADTPTPPSGVAITVLPPEAPERG